MSMVCHHFELRTYEFHCDGVLYLAIECRTCPVSTSMPISEPELFQRQLPIPVDERGERRYAVETRLRNYFGRFAKQPHTS